MVEQIGLGYRMLRAFAQFWINRFFRRIQINGKEHILMDGAVVFAINHPNNLIDSLLVGYAIERKIHYLATSKLFRHKLMSLFLHNAGVIPVYRKQDDPEYSGKNVSTFQACYDVLKNGGAVGIYPEGITHAEPRVKKIKTGAARISLETEHQFHPGVKIVPVGLNFSVRKSFRGEVIINVGAPMEVSRYLPQYEVESVRAVEQLTNDLQLAMEEEVIHVETPDLEKMVEDIEEIYKGELIRDLVEIGVSQKDVDGFRLSKKLIEGIHFHNRRDPARVMKIREEVLNYKSRLNRVHLQDEMLQKITNNPTSYRQFIMRVILTLAGFPFALWGTINHFLPYQLSRRISRKIAKRETDYATVRILCGMILYSIFYSAQIYWVLAHFGLIRAVIYGVTLPMFGAFAYYYWDKLRIFRNDMQLFFVMVTRKQLIRYLKERRDHLIGELDLAKEEYLSADLQA